MDPYQPKTILVVEDDNDAREIIASMLSMRYPDGRIYTAGDGKTGFETACSCHPDIVVTDINMPEMDGVRMIESIFALKPDTRFIVITAHSDKHNLEKITTTGVAVELVNKPVNFEFLFAAFERCIASLTAGE